MPTAKVPKKSIEGDSFASSSSRKEGRNGNEIYQRDITRILGKNVGEDQVEKEKAFTDPVLEPMRRKDQSSTSSKSKKQSSRSLSRSGKQTKRVSEKSHRELKDSNAGSHRYLRMSTSPIKGGIDNHCASVRSNKTEALTSQLMDQLASLKARNGNLEVQLERTKETLKEERSDMQQLEEENIDMQHDLAETRKVRDRLERENRVLRKKLIKREAENNRLQDRLDNLTGITGDESIVRHYECDPLESEIQNIRRGFQSAGNSRQSLSLWSLLAEETIAEEQPLQREPVSPIQSEKGVFGSFFGSSLSSSIFSGSVSRSLSGMSVMTNSSSHSQRIPARSLRSGGFVPAA